MTGMVLALAGLTCGDGGPGTGAATAPVESVFTQTWVGVGGSPGVTPLEVDFKRGYCRATPDGRRAQFRVTAVRGQDIRVRCLGQEHLGVFRLDGDTLYLVVSQKPNTRPRGFEPTGDDWFFLLWPATRTPPPASKRPGGDRAMFDLFTLPPGLSGLPPPGFPGARGAGGFIRPAAPRKP
jgi:hypothetical protein